MFCTGAWAEFRRSSLILVTRAWNCIRQRAPSKAAIANAVYHATGIRVRDLPITLDKLL